MYSSSTNHPRTADFEKEAENSDQDEKNYSSGEMDMEDIEWHYLEFSTELPSPTNITPSDGQEPPPAPPDLVKYTSPFEWSESRKNMIIWISCVITSLTAYTAGSYTPGLAQMTDEWHVSDVAALVGITMFTTGECV